MADARYGYRHQQERERWRPAVDALAVSCWRCGELIVPDYSKRGHGWDLGHRDGGAADEYEGPEHAGRCNRSSAARRGNRARNRARATRWAL